MRPDSPILDLSDVLHVIIPNVKTWAKFKETDGSFFYQPIVAIMIYKSGDIEHFVMDPDIGLDVVEHCQNLEGFVTEENHPGKTSPH